MLLLKFLPERILKLRMVQHIMGHIIEQVSQHKPCKKAIQHSVRKQPFEKEEKSKRQWYTRRRRHNQSLRIIWIIMMYTVKNKMDSFTPFRRWIKMKNEPVKNIFCQRPDKQSKQQIA